MFPTICSPKIRFILETYTFTLNLDVSFSEDSVGGPELG